MNRLNLIPKPARITFNLCITAFITITILLVHGPILQPAAAQSERASGVSETYTVFVAPPTGEKELDRASILAALDQVEPGGTIRFAPGTYLIGEIIHVTVPRITLLGHSRGTTLRGCDPTDFPESPDGLPELFVAVVKCNGLDMVGGYQSVLNFTFEYAWHALVLGGMECLEGRGCVPVLEPVESRPGGYLIQGNTFRNSANGVRTIGEWSEPAVIRENQFINTFHAAVIHGSTVHFLDNNIMVPEPEQVPSARHPGEALSLSATDLNSELTLRCTGNVIAGNRIEGHSDGISITLFRPGTSCRENVIQDNLIRVARVRVPSSWAAVSLTDTDSSVVGVPLALVGSSEAYYDLPFSLGETNQENRLEGNLIKGNHIQGAEGLGIELYRASGNQIVNNIIAGIKQRAPYPGLTVNSTNPERAGWREANGSGIWLSPGSNGNEIIGNTFDDIASSAVFVEGDSNRVEVLKADYAVHVLGSNNKVSTKNDHVEPLYESKFVESRGVRLQYMDFGGEGLPIIFLQEFHDYFYEGSEWLPFYAHFTSNHRVIAPYARGWSESDDTGWGYDVATQSEDILGFMDALGIQRAVLAGRTGGTHEMTWIAEHHPERVAGLLYIQNLRVFPDTRDPLARSFIEMTWITCHMGEDSVARLGPRSAWRPHFLFDESARVNIPSIRFFAPEFEQHSRELSVLSRIEQWGSEAASRCADEVTLEEYDALSRDKERVAALRKVLIEADLTSQTNRAMERAFGDYMTTIVWNEEVEDLLEFEIPYIDRFLEKVKNIEKERMSEVNKQ